MLRSSTATSGLWARITCIAVGTSPASATTSSPSWASISIRRPLRTTAWSSAITTRIGSSAMAGI
jgi:hypothetical protein